MCPAPLQTVSCPEGCPIGKYQLLLMKEYSRNVLYPPPAELLRMKLDTCHTVTVF